MKYLLAYNRPNFRVLKVLGCQHGCHNSIRPGQHSMAANTTPSGGDISALRARGIAILSRLLWYDKKQFKAYLTMFVETKPITFLLNFLHGYLSFCCDSTSPFSNVNVVQGSVVLGGINPNVNQHQQPCNASSKLNSMYYMVSYKLVFNNYYSCTRW